MLLRITIAAFMLMMTLSNLSHAFTISDGGKAACTVVIADDAIEPEKTAAKELADHLKQVTGGNFVIKTESQVSEDEPQILVGQSKRLKRLAGKVDWKSLGYDGIVVKTAGNKLLLGGGRQRGSLYAVYSFLEDNVGCRWWASKESFIPQKSTLQIDKLDKVYAPKFLYREAHYREPNEDPTLATRLKLNGHFHKIPKEYGGHYEIIGWCHTFYHFLPPGKYQKDHPDWYSAGQLCLTNEECRKEMTKVALEEIRKNPTAGIISISQNDGWGGNCECAKCQALMKEEGSAAGPMIHFVNAIAEEIEKEFPEVWVETLAYTYTRKPPLHVKPRHNVVVRLCSIECSFTHPLDSEMNKDFRDDIEKWSAIAPHLYIWDYVTDFSSYIFPHPNMRVIAPNIRFFEKHNTIGMFEQGDSATSVGDFVRLRAYVFGHLLWDPSLDEKKLTREFLNGYYGAAGPYIQSYLNLIHDRVQEKNTRLGLGHRDSSYLSFEDVQQALKLWQWAEQAVADDPVILKRIKRDRMSFDHVWLIRYNEFKEQAEKDHVEFLAPRNGKAAAEEWIKLAKDWNAGSYAEAQPFEAYVPELRARFMPPPPSNEEIDKMPKEDVIIIQQDKFTLFGAPQNVDLVDDPTASDGKAAKMPSTHLDWSTQCHFKEDLVKANPGKWHFYIVARCEAAGSGAGFRFGVYSAATGGNIAEMVIDLKDCRGEKYKSFYAGTHELSTAISIWSCPWNTAQAVQGIYIDRVVLVRDKE